MELGREVVVVSAAEAAQEGRIKFDMEDLKYIERMHEALQVLPLVRNDVAHVHGPFAGTSRGMRTLSFIVVYDDSAILKIANYERRTFEVVVGNSSSWLRGYLDGDELNAIYRLPESPLGFAVRAEDADEYNALHAARRQAADMMQAYMRAAALLACSTTNVAVKSNNDVVRDVANDAYHHVYQTFMYDLRYVAALLDIEHEIARDYNRLLKKMTRCESRMWNKA